MSKASKLWFNGQFGASGPVHLKMANIGNLSRRNTALLWLLAAAIFIGGFIYFEQIALLYVVATLGIVLLLLVVAFSDLENVGRENMDSN